MTRSAAEVERDVEETRGKLSRTVDALKEKMAPGELLDEATRSLGSTGEQIYNKVVEQAKLNPVPVALIGVGLAWLLAGGLTRKDNDTVATGSRYDPDGSDGQESGASRAGARHQTYAPPGGSRASGTLGSLEESLSSVTSKAKESFDRGLQSEPLLIAGIGAVVGLAIASALPSTEVENELLGDIHNTAVETGQQMAQEGIRDARTAVAETYNEVKSGLQAKVG